MIQFPLRVLRLSCGYSEEELAEFLDININTLATFENDTSLIPVSVIKKINKAFDIPLDFIYIGPEAECLRKNRRI